MKLVFYNLQSIGYWSAVVLITFSVSSLFQFSVEYRIKLQILVEITKYNTKILCMITNTKFLVLKIYTK